MEYRQLGRAGVRVSAIGLGTNRFGAEHVPRDAVNNIIDPALDVGINHIDTADCIRADGQRRRWASRLGAAGTGCSLLLSSGIRWARVLTIVARHDTT